MLVPRPTGMIIHYNIFGIATCVVIVLFNWSKPQWGKILLKNILNNIKCLLLYYSMQKNSKKLAKKLFWCLYLILLRLQEFCESLDGTALLPVEALLSFSFLLRTSRYLYLDVEQYTLL